MILADSVELEPSFVPFRAYFGGQNSDLGQFRDLEPQFLSYFVLFGKLLGVLWRVRALIWVFFVLLRDLFPILWARALIWVI